MQRDSQPRGTLSRSEYKGTAVVRYNYLGDNAEGPFMRSGMKGMM